MQTYTQTFATAQTWQLNIPGKYFTTLQCSSTVNVRFYLGGKKLDLGDITGLLAGLEVGPLADLLAPPAFDRVEVDVQAGDTVQVGIGNGATRYNRANASVTVVTNKAPQVGSATNTQKTVTSSSTQLVAANAARQLFYVQNKDPAGTIWISPGSGAATTANGIKIGPGDSFGLDAVQVTQEWRAIGDLATQNNVVVLEG